MGKNRQFATMQSQDPAQGTGQTTEVTQQETTQLQNTEQAQVQQDSGDKAIEENAVETTQTKETEVSVQPAAQESAPKITKAPEVIQPATAAPIAAPSTPAVVEVQTAEQSNPVPSDAVLNAVLVPEDIKDEVKPDFYKYLDHFNKSASTSTKAWARNVLATGIKYKHKRPIDTKGCLEATMFALNTMTSSIQFPEEAQHRMRFVYACFKWCDCIFNLELTGRGANQLTAQQYKQYNALSILFQYWAELGTGAQINKRFNMAKELGNVFEPAFAQRAIAIIGG